MAWGNRVRPSELFELASEEDLMLILPKSANLKPVDCGWEVELRNPFGTVVEFISAGDLRRALYAALRASAKTAVSLEKGYCPWCNRFHRFGHMKSCLWVEGAEMFLEGLVSPKFEKVFAGD
jgi:hypothetical protein